MEETIFRRLFKCILSRWLYLGLLFFIITACGGGSGGAPAGDAGQNSQLYVLDSGHGVVAALESVPVASGDLTANILSSSHAFGEGIAYDSGLDQLYVTTAFPQTSIDISDNASSLTGSNTSGRSISPSIANLAEIEDILLDEVNDTLYVLASTTYEGVIAVFEHVSQLAGAVTPSRLISNVGRGNFAIDFDRGILYNKDQATSGGTIHAFDNIDTLNGDLDFSNVRMILIGGSFNISGLAVDPKNDRLYAVEESRGIRIIESASTAGFIFGTGPFVYLDPPLISLPTALFDGNRLAYDEAADRLYAGFGALTYTINDASALDLLTSPSGNALLAYAPSGSVISGFAFP